MRLRNTVPMKAARKTLAEDQFSEFRVVDRQYLPNVLHPKHIDVTPRLSIILSGKLKETAGRSEEFAQSTSIVIKPGHLEHENLFGPKGARVISIEMKLGKKLKPSLEAAFQNWRWFHGVPSAQIAMNFLKEIKMQADKLRVEESLIDLLASLPQKATEKPLSYPPDWLYCLEEKLRDEFEEPIYVQDLAEEIGIHPVYLARVFRRYYHCSVKEFIRKLRVNKVLDGLASGHKPLVDLAIGNGFSDQSHLNRVFKSELGLSPGQFRQFVKEF